jgi:hypothetical protein
MPCISMGSGTPVLTVNALSTKLDGITPFISPVLSESRTGDRHVARYGGQGQRGKGSSRLLGAPRAHSRGQACLEWRRAFAAVEPLSIPSRAFPALCLSFNPFQAHISGQPHAGGTEYPDPRRLSIPSRAVSTVSRACPRWSADASPSFNPFQGLYVFASGAPLRQPSSPFALSIPSRPAPAVSPVEL